MRMRRMAGLLFAGGLAAGLGAGMTAIARNGGRQRWQFSGGRFAEVSNTSSGLCIGFPGGGSPVTAARLGFRDCNEAPGWQLVRQSRDSTDPLFELETSGPGGPALCMAAGNLGDNDQTPPVAAGCQGFGSAAESLELG